MGEPIRLYDRDGNEVIMYSPNVAAAMVDAGQLFVEPPVLTPDDTQEVPTVRKPGRPRKDTGGGVL